MTVNQQNGINFVPDPKDVTQEMLYSRCNDLYSYNQVSNPMYRSWANPNYKSQYNLLASYALGDQGMGRYIKNLVTTSAKNKVFSQQAEAPSRVINWAYRAINVLIGELNKVQFAPVINPIDPAFKDDKRTFENMVKAVIEIQDVLVNREAVLKEFGIDPAAIPQTDLELDQFFSENPKLLFIKDIIDEITQQTHIADWETIRQQLIVSLIVWNIACMISYVDENGNYNMRYVEPINMLLGADPTESFKDLNEAGAMRYVNIFDIAKTNAFTDEQIQKIAENYKISLPEGFFGYRNNFTGFAFPNTFIASCMSNTLQNNVNIKIPIMDGFFLFTHNRRFNVKDPKLENTTKRYISEPPTKQGENIVSQYYQVWYRCSWVIGGDQSMVYDYGPIRNSIIKPYDPTRPARPFHVFMPNKIAGESKSIVEVMIPYIDQAQLAFTHIQKLDSEYVPPGYVIGTSMLQNIRVGDKTFDPFQFVEAFRSTGYIIKDDQFDDLENSVPPVFEPAGRPPYLEEKDKWFLFMMRAVDMIGTLCGLNDVIQGSNPNPEVGKAQSEIAVSSAQTAVSHLYRAQNRLYGSICQDILINWQYKQAINPKSPWHNIAFRQLAVSIENAPSDREWNIIYDAANKAIMAGTLYPTDFLKLIEFKNIADAIAYLRVREKQVIKEKAEQSQANIQLQSEGNMQAGVAVEQEKGKNLSIQFELNAQLQELKTQGELQKIEAQKNADLEIVAAKAGMQTESQQMIDDNRATIDFEKTIDQAALQQSMIPQETMQPEQPDAQELMSIQES